ncbi:2443_t:CDS:2, partial [Funneliformis geosporum]
ILARIKKGFEDLRKTNEGNNFISTTELKDEIIEKYIPIIIKKYVGYPNENVDSMTINEDRMEVFGWKNDKKLEKFKENLRVVVKESGHVITNAVAAFRQRLEREIDDLNDELLSFGQKKADLLRKLEETFENGIKKVESAQPSASTTNDKVSENSDNETDSDTSDDYSEVSSIFDEYNEDEVKGEAENTDNSSVGSADNNKPKYDNLKEGHEDPKFIEGSRESNVKYVMNLLNKEPVVKEEDLEVENPENKELAAELESISEIKYNEEEKQFLAGEITERQKQEEIAQQIEEKLNARLLKKNNKIGFEKKVEQIKQEIKKAENNSNLHVQQAFKHAKNKAEALLRDLESIASDNSNTAKNNNFPTS